MKYLVSIAFVGILASLVMAGVFMLRDGRNRKPKRNLMMRALAVRVGLSVLLFVCILGSYSMGWIHPTGIPMGK